MVLTNDLVNFLDELRGWHGGELRGESLELGEGLGVHSVHVVHLLLDDALGGISQRFHLLEEITAKGESNKPMTQNIVKNIPFN